jgi:hypothetical protein
MTTRIITTSAAMAFELKTITPLRLRGRSPWNKPLLLQVAALQLAVEQEQKAQLRAAAATALRGCCRRNSASAAAVVARSTTTTLLLLLPHLMLILMLTMACHRTSPVEATLPALVVVVCSAALASSNCPTAT